MRSIYLFLFLVVSSIQLNGQILEPVKWKISYEHISGDEYNLLYKASMEEPWVVYSQYTSDDGPVPTSINYESEGFELKGKSTETGHKKEGFDKMFETEVIKFLPDQPYVITQKVTAKPGTEISGYLTFMTCNNERCLPPTDVDFSLKLKASAATKEAPKTPAANDTQKTTTGTGSSVGTKTTATKHSTIPAVGTAVSTKVEEAVTNKVAEVKKVVKEAPATINVKGNTSGINISGDNVKLGDININQQADETSQPADGLLNPVSWDIITKDLGNNNYEIVYTATAEDPWMVYSQFTSDDGPVPTSVTYETAGVEQQGKGTETGHKKQGYDKMFDTEVIKFMPDKPFVITHKIKTPAEKIKGYLTYMTCNNSRCLPPTDVNFAFDLKKGVQLDYDDFVDGAAAPMTGSKLTASAGPNISGNTLDNKIPAITASYASPIGNCKGGEEESSSLFNLFFFGLIGGLIALLTPCVFPMIPLTVSFFTKDTKRKGWVNGLIYGASIIVIYVALGLGLTAIFGEEALNRLSTDWIANTAFFLIFIFFAFSFFGFYEITLPSSWTTKSDGMADKGGLLGIFFMAFTLALVSFSCTGPIIGTAIVQAASTGSKLGPAIVMGGFALGLALPFGVFAAVPALLNSLPRSGGWMNSVKVVLGFLELALAFKFLSVADMTNHWGFLRYELFMAIWVLCFAGMTAYLGGLRKFPQDSPVKKLSPMRMVFALASLAWTIYLATGFFIDKENGGYNSLAAMSGLAPPSNYNFFLDAPSAGADKSIKEAYPSYTLCANNIPCFKDYYEGKAYAQANNKPIFLDFTGYGCVNCRKTEEHIWVDDDIKKKLTDDFVLVSLYVDDDKKLENTYVSKHREGKKIRNVGNMWADFQIINFQQNSQPLYVMMTPDEKVMAKPRGYKEGISDYQEYLDCGLDTYKKVK